MGPEALAQVLRPLLDIFRSADNPDVLSSLDHAADAAVIRLSHDRAMIQSVDYFPPLVDDPYLYGAIAAANAMSDVYAVGGEVALALSVAAFPESLPTDYLAEITRGAADKVREAGAVIVGGHTLLDPVPKYGLCVTGFAHPDAVLSKAGARAGDVLLLTKRLGAGVILTADKRRLASGAHVAAAAEQMAGLNRSAALALQAVRRGIHAVTDITGFGLIGHSWEMAEQSGVCLRFHAESLPYLAGALDYARAGIHCSATARNRSFFAAHVRVEAPVEPAADRLLFGSESSGGLLVSIDPESLHDLQQAMDAVKQVFWLVGDVVPGSGIVVD